MARPPRAVFVTLAVTLALPIALTAAAGAQAVPGRSQSDTTAPLVLPPATTEGVAPTPAGIKAALSAAFSDPSLGPHHGVYVYDASRGKPLLALNATTPYVPASTMKLLTTVSALETLGADHTFTTKAVSATKGSVVLVGGGDPLLALRPGPATDFPQRATLQELATGTAKSLAAQGVSAVTLGYDAGLFTGPAANAKWEPNYLTEGIAARTSALWFNEGRLSAGMAKRAPSPALAAASAFSGLLKKAGIKVTSTPKPVVAPSTATELAQVRSPTLGDIVEYINLHSDNDGAEVLLRQVGIATGNGGSYTGGVKGLRATLTKLGIDMSKATIYDGSGLSRSNHVPLEVLAGAVRMAVGHARAAASGEWSADRRVQRESRGQVRRPRCRAGHRAGASEDRNAHWSPLARRVRQGPHRDAPGVRRRHRQRATCQGAGSPCCARPHHRRPRQLRMFRPVERRSRGAPITSALSPGGCSGP